MRASRIVAVLAAVAAAGGIITGSAGAATSWKAFGSATGRGGGSYGSPYLNVDSTTSSRPTRIKIEITASTTPAPRTRVSWSLACWNEQTYAYDYRSGSGTVTLPWTKELAPTVANPSYCSTDVTAWHLKTTRITIRESAKY